MNGLEMLRLQWPVLSQRGAERGGGGEGMENLEVERRIPEGG